MNNEDQNNIELPKEKIDNNDSVQSEENQPQNVDTNQEVQMSPDQNELTKIMSEANETKQEAQANEVANEQVQKSQPANQQEQTPQEIAPQPNLAETPQPAVQTQVQVAEVPQPNIQANSVNINSTTIGTIKPDKQKSPVTMVALFALLLLFLAFMPQAVSFLNEKFGDMFTIFEEDTTGTNNTSGQQQGGGDSSNGNQQSGEKSHTELYDLADTTKIALDKLEFTGFKKTNTNGNQLTFTVRNTGVSMYKTTKKLFLEYYNDNKTFINRSYIVGFKEVSSGVTNEYTVDVTNDVYQNATKLEVVLKTEDEYDPITLNNDILTCVKGGQTLTYGFTKDKLNALKDVYVYTKTGDSVKYNLDLIAAKTKNDNLDLITGVTGVFTENENGYVSTVSINYNAVDYSMISSDSNYYIKDTEPKVISFEMNAKGYTCR